jgi:RNA polymerase sigma-70 factor (ECF subfamily)
LPSLYISSISSTFRVPQGDSTAFDALFRNNWDHVFSTALVMTKATELSNDIAQEVFMALWQHRHAMVDVENLNAYLFTTTRNQIFQKLRRLKLEDAYLKYSAGQMGVTINTSDTERVLSVGDLKKLIAQGINQLPPQQQCAFRLSREQGLTHEQIAQEMGISKQSVKDYIVRAIAFLRKYLQSYGEFAVFLLFYFIL